MSGTLSTFFVGNIIDHGFFSSERSEGGLGGISGGGSEGGGGKVTGDIEVSGLVDADIGFLSGNHFVSMTTFLFFTGG